MRTACGIAVVLGSFLALGLVAFGGDHPGGSRPFLIEAVDDQTGRGVPLIELETVNNVRFVTDSQGLAAIDEPGFAGQSVFFHVKSHGYEFPKDGFGMRGRALWVTPGERARLKIKRLNRAERLYRVTGAGIYRDSVLAGIEAPTQKPLLNGQVLGSDSVVNAIYKGQLRWFWGDTNRPGYPFGLFHVPGAVSQLPSKGGLDPARGVDLEYFVDETGFVRAMAQMPGEGPTWIDGLTVVTDEAGHEKMLASYVKIRPPLETYERGFVLYDDKADQFRKLSTFDLHAPLRPQGHPLHVGDGRQGHIYYGPAVPLARSPARAESIPRLEEYEGFSCLREGSTLANPQIDRNADGSVRYAWKRGTPPVGPAEIDGLVRKGLLNSHEALLQLRDRDSGRPLRPHHGSVCWNEFRKRFVLIDCEEGGSSYLGETWYAEADTPVGPWVYAVKVVTHDNYSFYNPKQHPYFDADGGQTIYFEGTYTHTFSGNTVQTPRYDYNQIMYRLDLTDDQLAIPVAIYRTVEKGAVHYGERPETTVATAPVSPDLGRLAWFAFDRLPAGAVAVFANREEGSVRLSQEQGEQEELPPIAFYAYPADAQMAPAATVPLYEFVSADGRPREYTTDADWKREGFSRAKQPVCRVWPSPYRK